jgi:GNAT superfamily N-acetyltransferase
MIGNIVKVIVDRPLGTHHPKHKDIYYSVNYGYIPGVMAPDGEEQDAYILGVYAPVSEFLGKVIAIIHRLDDVEDKWVVAPENASFTKEEIMAQTAFQEQYFRTEIRMREPDILQLVRCSVEDRELIREMQKEAFAALLEKYQDHDTSPANESMERITWKLQQPDSHFYRIEVGGKVVGAIRVVHSKDGSRKRISPLFILPQYRGKGYAQAAILEAEKHHGAHNWELGTILQEAGNCYLYEKMGYHQTSRQTIINDKMTIIGYEKD